MVRLFTKVNFLGLTVAAVFLSSVKGAAVETFDAVQVCKNLEKEFNCSFNFGIQSHNRTVFIPQDSDASNILKVSMIVGETNIYSARDGAVLLLERRVDLKDGKTIINLNVKRPHSAFLTPYTVEIAKGQALIHGSPIPDNMEMIKNWYIVSEFFLEEPFDRSYHTNWW